MVPRVNFIHPMMMIELEKNNIFGIFRNEKIIIFFFDSSWFDQRCEEQERGHEIQYFWLKIDDDDDEFKDDKEIFVLFSMTIEILHKRTSWNDEKNIKSSWFFSKQNKKTIIFFFGLIWWSKQSKSKNHNFQKPNKNSSFTEQKKSFRSFFLINTGCACDGDHQQTSFKHLSLPIFF